MKATGIVRRIDDLGRIVVPKEIRRVLRIREGDSMEIFTDADGTIILRKYSPIGEIGNVAKQCASAINKVCGHMVLITDRDSVVAVAGNVKKDIVGKNISRALESLIMQRTLFHNTREKRQVINFVDDDTMGHTEEIVAPIICEGDVIGGVIIAVKEDNIALGKTEEKIAAMVSDFLGTRMEV